MVTTWKLFNISSILNDTFMLTNCIIAYILYGIIEEELGEP